MALFGFGLECMTDSVLIYTPSKLLNEYNNSGCSDSEYRANIQR